MVKIESLMLLIIIYTTNLRCTLRSETTSGNWKPFKTIKNEALFVLNMFLIMVDLYSVNVDRGTDAIRWRMGFFFNLNLKRTKCSVLFTNQKQPLKCVRQNNNLDFWSNTLYIIWQGVYLLVKLQAWGSNQMKSFTGMSQGFDKCTKATLQINYFSRTNTMTASALKHD